MYTIRVFFANGDNFLPGAVICHDSAGTHNKCLKHRFVVLSGYRLLCMSPRAVHTETLRKL